MKKVAFLLSAALLGGCAANPQNQTQVNLYQACSSLYLAQTGAQALRDQNKLTVQQIQQLTVAQKTLVPLCNPQTMPTNPTAAAQQITQAVTTGVLAMGIQYAQSIQPAKAASQAK